MKKITGSTRQSIMKRHSIGSFFSFPMDRHLEVHVFERDEWLIREGTRPDYFYYVIEGKAKIYVTYSNGKVYLINFVNAHDFIGEMELVNEVYYSKGIQALTRTVCYAVPLESFRDQLLEDATFLRELTKFLTLKATAMSAKYSQTLSFPLENRLADFILQTADGTVYKEKHVTVCDFLGVSYRHLLHVLSSFTQKGYIRKEGTRYIITDARALEVLAELLRNES